MKNRKTVIETLRKIKVGDIVMVDGCKSKITKIEPPTSVFVKNIDNPKGNWVAQIVDIEKIELIKNV